jgi:hypothetical protein
MSDVPRLDLSSYRRIVILTGAGISVASGLPTYRGAGGLWNEVDVAGHATAAAVQTDPAREPMTPHNPAFREVLLGRAEEVLPELLGGVAQGASPTEAT